MEISYIEQHPLAYTALIFISQLAFNILKVLEIRYTMQHNIKMVLINSIFINICLLTSMFASIDALLQGNFIVLLFYVGGALLGKYIGMLMKIDGASESASTIISKNASKSASGNASKNATQVRL